ncbi:hypothetical protein COTS27_00713 [Spirochaetota bacterium]|nr:hypothetical protein COTS27_00713 [Spirochaetota bacterium]
MLPNNIDWNNPTAVAEIKKKTKTMLRNRMQKNAKETWKDIVTAVTEETEKIHTETQQYGSAIPEVKLEDIEHKTVSATTIERILNRGAVVIRNIVDSAQMTQWYENLIDYIEENKYYDQDIDPNLDKYFSDLDSKKPQIFNIYWSHTQMNIRQHKNMAKAKQFLNHLWKHEVDGVKYFDPDKECIYADRFRMRAPGDTSLGLSPHIDGGSVERWIDNANQKIYNPIFEGNWKNYDPFNGAYRNEVANIPSPAVCRAFRTYQGWVALTKQGPGDGTLQLVPMVKQSTAYLLMRPFQDDIQEEVLCGAEPARAQAINDEWHQILLNGLVSIPLMQPGDTVWWHHDLIHAVENEHSGDQTSSVVYVGSAPLCERNRQYLELQKQAYLKGHSAPDFAPEHREVAYAHRSHLEDLSDLGKKEMGFIPWS